MGHLTSQGDPVHGGSQFGNQLGSLIALDSEGNPVYDSSGELILSGLGKSVSDNWNQLVTGYDDPSGYGQGDILQDIIGNYYDYGWDSWADPWYQGHYQGETDSMADLAKHTWFSESLGDVTARQEERKKEGLGPAGMRASEMEQMYDKNFAAKATPLADPGFSEFVMGKRGTTPAEDIIYSKGLWEQARIT